jgi:hypothetical protein
VCAGCGGPNEAADARPAIGLDRPNAPRGHYALRLVLREGDTYSYQATHAVRYRLTGELSPEPISHDERLAGTQRHRVVSVSRGRARMAVEDVPEGETRGTAAEFQVTDLGVATPRRGGPVAYNGVILPQAPIRPGDTWQAEVSIPVGGLVQRVVPADWPVTVTLSYSLRRVEGGKASIRYSGSGPLDYAHAADSAKGTLSVSGEAEVDVATGAVLLNSERASLEADLRWGGSEGKVSVEVRSRSARLGGTRLGF